MIRRLSSPVVQLIPAVSEAIMVEKGFVVEHIVPIPEPRKIQASKTGISMG